MICSIIHNVIGWTMTSLDDAPWRWLEWIMTPLWMHPDSNNDVIRCTMMSLAGQSGCSTTGKPTRSFATERVSLDSV